MYKSLEEAPVHGEMLGYEFSSYPQGAGARDTLDCDIEAFLHDRRVFAKSKLRCLLAKFSFSANWGISEG